MMYNIKTKEILVIDVNECEVAASNGCDKDEGSCTNRIPSQEFPLGYSCACNEGYEGDGFSCTGDVRTQI